MTRGFLTGVAMGTTIAAGLAGWGLQLWCGRPPADRDSLRAELAAERAGRRACEAGWRESNRSLREATALLAAERAERRRLQDALLPGLRGELDRSRPDPRPGEGVPPPGVPVKPEGGGR